MTKETDIRQPNLISLKNKAKSVSFISLAIFFASLSPSLFAAAGQANHLDKKIQATQLLENSQMSPLIEAAKFFSSLTFLISGATALYTSSQIPKINSLKLIKKYKFESKLTKATGLSLDVLCGNYDDEITDFIKNYSSLKDEFDYRYILRNGKTLSASQAFFQFSFPTLIKYIKSKSDKDKGALSSYFTKIHDLVIESSQTRETS